MDYVTLKSIHQALALISVSGFVLRWTWMARGSSLTEHRLTRTLPHVVDTLFLGSGIWLATMLGLSIPGSGWLTAKLVGLVVYIALASLAYRRLDNARARAGCFVGALVTFGWVVSVALTHSPWGFLATLY